MLMLISSYIKCNEFVGVKIHLVPIQVAITGEALH